MTNRDFSSAYNFHLYMGGARLESLLDNDYLTEVYRSFSQILQEGAWRIPKIWPCMYTNRIHSPTASSKASSPQSVV